MCCSDIPQVCFFTDKVIFQIFWSINASSFEFCKSELPNNLADLAEAAVGQRCSNWNYWVLLPARKHFCKYTGFHKVVKVLKYSPKCVFNDTSKCFLIDFEVSVFAVKYRGMFCSTCIRQANRKGSQAGFVCKRTSKNPANPPKNGRGRGRMERNTVGTTLRVEKGRKECWMYQDVALHPLAVYILNQLSAKNR